MACEVGLKVRVGFEGVMVGSVLQREGGCEQKAMLGKQQVL